MLNQSINVIHYLSVPCSIPNREGKSYKKIASQVFPLPPSKMRVAPRAPCLSHSEASLASPSLSPATGGPDICGCEKNEDRFAAPEANDEVFLLDARYGYASDSIPIHVALG